MCVERQLQELLCLQLGNNLDTTGPNCNCEHAAACATHDHEALQYIPAVLAIGLLPTIQIHGE
jgi:hypothetical protein